MRNFATALQALIEFLPAKLTNRNRATEAIAECAVVEIRMIDRVALLNNITVEASFAHHGGYPSGLHSALARRRVRFYR
jgi:hypothetical protein